MVAAMQRNDGHRHSSAWLGECHTQERGPPHGGPHTRTKWITGPPTPQEWAGNGSTLRTRGMQPGEDASPRWRTLPVVRDRRGPVWKRGAARHGPRHGALRPCATRRYGIFSPARHSQTDISRVHRASVPAWTPLGSIHLPTDGHCGAHCAPTLQTPFQKPPFKLSSRAKGVGG